MKIFQKKNMAVGFFTILLVAVSSICHATPVLPSHENPQWQSVYGIEWSTDGGQTWGTETVSVGDTVTFQVTMFKNEKGTHYLDMIKAWADWSGDGLFTEDEAIVFGYSTVHRRPVENNSQTPYIGDHYSYISTDFLMTEDLVGTYDILLRATCSESVISYTNWSEQWGYSADQYNSFFNSTDALYQGNAMFAEFTVVSNPVPEPATMFLFGVGLVGLATVSRKKLIKK